MGGRGRDGGRGRWEGEGEGGREMGGRARDGKLKSSHSVNYDQCTHGHGHIHTLYMYMCAVELSVSDHNKRGYTRPMGWEPLTCSFSVNWHSMTMALLLNSHIILQKSFTVLRRGACVAM